MLSIWSCTAQGIELLEKAEEELAQDGGYGIAPAEACPGDVQALASESVGVHQPSPHREVESVGGVS